MMFALISGLAASIALGLPSGQTAPGAPEPQDPPSQLEEIVVTASPSVEAATAFVRVVAAPAPDREMALWRGPVCVGVGGMQPDAARYMADRISDWAASLGLEIGAPGCRPNIFIVATDDGDATARDLVASRPREFRTGVAGSDRGGPALREFQSSGRPVRWWHVSLPVDEETGNPIRRLPGQPPVEWTGRNLTRRSDFGVNSMAVSPSRLSSRARDDLQQVIVVVDTAALETADFRQLTDYVAMAALAQIEPGAEPAYPSILHLFANDMAAPDTLSRWDIAFLRGLYEAEQNRTGAGANLSAVADAMARELEADAR
jgi:hypothetical protein